MEMAKRARTAETPKQTSHPLRPYAPHFYPDIRTSGSVRGEEGNLVAYSTSARVIKDGEGYRPIFRRRR